MSATEFAFLAAGLLLGIAVGAAIAEALRARPADRREVRVTVAHDAVARRRPATLAAGGDAGRTPAAGGPAEPPAHPSAGTSIPVPLEPGVASPAPPAAPMPPGPAPAGESAPSTGATGGPAVGGRPLGAGHDAAGYEDPGRFRTAVPIVRTVPGRTGEGVPVEADEPPVAGVRTAPPDAAVGAAATGSWAAIPTGGVAPPEGEPRREAAAVSAVPAEPAAPPDRAVAWLVEAETAGPGPASARPPAPGPGTVEPARAEAGPGVAVQPGRPRRQGIANGPVDLPEAAIGIPIGEDPQSVGVAATAAPASGTPGHDAAGDVAPSLPPDPGPAGGPSAERRSDQTPRASSTGAPSDHQGAAPSSATTGVCDEERRIASERSSLAEVARGQADAAADALRLARRAYDDLRTRVDRAEATVDPRALRSAKDAAHEAFRLARAAAPDREGQEAAARDWLSEINRLNHEAREAATVIERDGAELRSLVPRLDRLAIDADAARISFESADLACREAREALARCEEAAAAPAEPAEAPEPGGGAWPTEGEVPFSGPPPLDGSGSAPVVFRLLRGEREARDRLVAAVAGDPEDAHRWKLRIADLVDAIVARAIEDGVLDLPETNPFWAAFTHVERRDIVAALSALGFRFDGLGSFADEHIPGQRDLSLAVGYAGLDRMRVRLWPREEELPTLYRGATVAADEWLAWRTATLELGEMIDALGGRAGELADIWNAWGRLRPVLLATD